jgi:hypothetical protein
MRDLWAGRRSRVFLLGLGAATAGTLCRACPAQSLPDAPSALLAQAQEVDRESLSAEGPDSGNEPQQSAPVGPPPCPVRKPTGSPPAGKPVQAQDRQHAACIEENPLQPILASRNLPPLTSQQKGYLAVRDVIDPFNLVTIVGYSGIVVASNAHTAYGPGMRGFGRLTGYSMVEDMQGEFFGTYVIPSLAHQDPRYYRIPGRPFPRRLLHAISHTVVTRHDDGSYMPNYATLLTYPISAEMTNLYVPGVQTDSASTAKRVALGLSTDPVGQIIAEFLPDVARRIHIRVIFVQQILQQVAQGSTGGPVMTQ